MLLPPLHSMRSEAPLFSSLCPFPVFPRPQCPVSPLQGTEVSGTECSPALGQPQFCSRLQALLWASDPRRAEKWEGTAHHLGWLVDVKGCGWTAGWGHSHQMA